MINGVTLEEIFYVLRIRDGIKDVNSCILLLGY